MSTGELMFEPGFDTDPTWYFYNFFSEQEPQVKRFPTRTRRVESISGHIKDIGIKRAELYIAGCSYAGLKAFISTATGLAFSSVNDDYLEYNPEVTIKIPNLIGTLTAYNAEFKLPTEGNGYRHIWADQIADVTLTFIIKGLASV